MINLRNCRFNHNRPWISIKILMTCVVSVNICLHRRHKELIGLFFENASKMLLHGGEVHVTHKLGPPYDQWGLVEQAQASGLDLKDNPQEFHRSIFPGYCNRRGAYCIRTGALPGATFGLGKCATFMFHSRLACSLGFGFYIWYLWYGVVIRYSTPMLVNASGAAIEHSCILISDTHLCCLNCFLWWCPAAPNVFKERRVLYQASKFKESLPIVCKTAWCVTHLSVIILCGYIGNRCTQEFPSFQTTWVMSIASGIHYWDTLLITSKCCIQLLHWTSRCLMGLATFLNILHRYSTQLQWTGGSEAEC